MMALFEKFGVARYILDMFELLHIVPNANGKGVAYESISVAKGAEFVPPKFSSTTALEGDGEIEGDLALEEGFSVKVTAGEPLTVTGKLTLPQSGTIEISGDAMAYGPNDVITLVSAGSTVAAANSAWTVIGSIAGSRRKVVAFADAGGLKAKIVLPGMTIIIR